MLFEVGHVNDGIYSAFPRPEQTSFRKTVRPTSVDSSPLFEEENSKEAGGLELLITKT
jgi:hypothetical protein